MEFTVTIDPETNTLHCNLIRAKGLRGMDINGLCDSYCRAQLLPVTSGKVNFFLSTSACNFNFVYFSTSAINSEHCKQYSVSDKKHIKYAVQ
jgi:hypothetical protein